MPEPFAFILKNYIHDVKTILGTKFIKARLYGSLVRGEYTDESDIDIAIFTNISPEYFYQLASDISEITFEYNVKYDIILSPVFVNQKTYQRMLPVMPYYQNIEKEGIAVG